MEEKTFFGGHAPFAFTKMVVLCMILIHTVLASSSFLLDWWTRLHIHIRVSAPCEDGRASQNFNRMHNFKRLKLGDGRRKLRWASLHHRRGGIMRKHEWADWNRMEVMHFSLAINREGVLTLKFKLFPPSINSRLQLIPLMERKCHSSWEKKFSTRKWK